MNKIKTAVEKNTGRILEAERFIWEHPETGYKEYKTSNYMAEIFKPLFATKEEFLSYLDSLNSSGDRIIYREDGSAEIKA